MAINHPTNVLDLMDSETKRASERASGAFVPTFLRLTDGQKARISPLFNLTQCVVMAVHNQYNAADPKQSINAICGLEVGNECLHCEAVPNNKKLSAGTVFFLPVYVSTLEQKNDAGIYVPVTYEKDGQTCEVNGLRILELKAFGTVSIIMQTLRGLYADDDRHDIRQYGLIVERIGSGQKTNYTVLPKGPRAMPDVAKALIPTPEKVREMVLAALPPATVISSAPAATSSSKVSEKDNDF